MSVDNLEDVIVSSIEDAVTEPDSTPDIDTSDDSFVEASTDPTTSTPDDATTEGATDDSSIEVASPAAKSAETKTDDAKDDFEKRFGIPATSSGGRENRIPYSRVKKIVAKREKEIESEYTPRITEYETKVKDYETRLTQVAQFEHIMANEPEKFVGMLKTLPAYKDYFDKLEAAATAKPAEPATPIDPNSDMPQPNQKLADGSMVYDMEGIKALNEWNRAKARQEALAEVNKIYGPIQQQFEAQRKLQEVMPQIQRQIDEARKWPMFQENEDEIAKALNADKALTLERAYQQVVYPKLATSKDQLRQEILKELKRAPTATSAPTGAVKPAPAKTGPRSLEDVIQEQVNAVSGR